MACGNGGILLGFVKSLLWRIQWSGLFIKIGKKRKLQGVGAYYEAETGDGIIIRDCLLAGEATSIHREK